MTVSTALGVIFPLLTVIIGGACILLFSITTTLRTSNGDLRDRVSDLEAKSVRDEAKITAQASEIVALQKVVTGADQLAYLSTVLDAHHTESTVALARIEKNTDTILEKVSTP